jgi:hypothetical protein
MSAACGRRCSRASGSSSWLIVLGEPFVDGVFQPAAAAIVKDRSACGEAEPIDPKNGASAVDVVFGYSDHMSGLPDRVQNAHPSGVRTRRETEECVRSTIEAVDGSR